MAKVFTARKFTEGGMKKIDTTKINKWILVVSIGSVCTFYTSIGGIKAVMWTVNN